MDFEKCLSKENYEVLERAVNDFYYVGVRDQKTYTEVDRALKEHSKIHMCCDPSFLYDFNLPNISVDDICHKKLDKNKKTILVMTELTGDTIAEDIYAQTKGQYNLISVFNKHKGYINLADITPLEWLKLIKDVDLVISSFFHAICFSIVLNTPFIACGTSGKSSKLSELLAEDNLKSHYLEETDYSNANWNKLIALHMTGIDFSEYVHKCRNGFLPFINMLRDLNIN